MAIRKRKKSSRVLAVVVLLLAWLIPGAGHVFIGRVTRGIIIFVTITATFWAGVAMGGVMTVDKRTEKWWFAADLCTGLNGLVGWYRSHQVYADVDRILESPEWNARFAEDRGRAVIQERDSGRYRYKLSAADEAAVLTALRERYVDKILSNKGCRLVAPAETVARAYAGVAGLLNALCIFDAVVLALMGMGLEPARPRAPRDTPRPEAGHP